MKNCRLFGLLALLVILVGCGGGSKLVGTWTDGKGEFTFNGDNTFTAGNTTDIPDAPPGMRMTMSGTYEYKEADKSLTFTATKANVTGLSPEMQKMAEQGMSAMLNKPQASKVEWKSDDEIVATEASGSVTTYKRKK